MVLIKKSVNLVTLHLLGTAFLTLSSGVRNSAFLTIFFARNSRFLTIILLSASLLLTGCLKETPETESGISSGGFTGCVSGESVDATTLRIHFEFPDNYSRITVYRNGQVAYSSMSRSSTHFLDMGLQEAATYEYTCEGILNSEEILGTQSLTLTTSSSNPPVFAGITTATAQTPRSVQVTWGSASSGGPIVSTYQVYANPGSSVNWLTTPRAIVATGTFTYTLSNLGDELPYVFGVRACTAHNVCDTNVVQRAVTLADGGVPLTNGPSSASAANSEVTLTIPWVEANGAVKRRYVYRKIGGVASTNLGDYTLDQTLVVADLANPQTSTVIPGIADNTQYHFIVRDEDPTGNSNASTNVVSLFTGDTLAPTFSGITSLLTGVPTSTSLDLGWIAIPREGTGDAGASTGASSYLVLGTSVAFPATPADPCSSGTVLTTLSAAGYPPGFSNYSLSGLTPRTTYSICMKARDAAGNTSGTTAYLTKTTLDVTAPAFDGLQTLTFNSVSKALVLSWNASSSSDIDLYRIRIWKNTTTPAVGDITTIDSAASTYTTGRSLTQANFTYSNLDTVYAVVDACDNANTIPGGSQNCTSAATSAARSVTLPNFEPPAGFPGIKNQTFQNSPSQGQMTVAWDQPGIWTADYYGFKVYEVTTGPVLTLLKTCPCAIPGSCVSPTDLSCTVTGLSPGKTYRFHVRAYNNSAFETDYLDPLLSYADKKVLDSTAPTFNSSFTIGAGPTYNMSWAAATDNQHPSLSITYLVYRKANTTFGTATNPSADGTLITSTTGLTYSDSGWTDGTTYYYAVCAVDASNNATCDGTIRAISVTDVTAPVITSLTATKTSSQSLKRWSVNWTMADNTTASGNLRVRLYRSVSVTASTATTSDTEILDGIGDTTLANEIGPLNQRSYVNYLLWVQDEAGNIKTETLSVLSENTITFTSISRNSGTTGGNQIVVIEGTGFSDDSNNGYGLSTDITIGGNTCTSVDVVNSSLMTCITPAGANGAATVALTNPEGSSAISIAAFTYLVVSPEICDNPGGWTANGMASGNGIIGTPFIICTKQQLARMSMNVADGASHNFRTGGYYFELGANINLSGYALNPITAINFNFNGDDYSILNFSFSGNNQTTGFFAAPGAATIQNLKLINVNINNTGAASYNTGGLIGQISSPSIISNIFLSGIVFSSVVNGNSYVGGLAGSAGSLTLDNIRLEVNVTRTSWNGAGVNGTGGVVGTGGDGTWTNIHVRGNINGTSSTAGFVGYSGAQNISSSSFEGNIVGTSCVAGLLGTCAYSTTNVISDSYVKATINTSYGSAVFGNGAVGANTVTNSYFIVTFLGSGYRSASSPWASPTMGNVLMAVDSMSALSDSGIISWPYAGCTSTCFADTTTYAPFTYTTGTNVSNLPTSTLQNQAPGNVYEAAGWDFTPVTGKWKWCGASDYPHLMWETCP